MTPTMEVLNTLTIFSTLFLKHL
ncbi:unnamed protein product [Victoria cruziana]